MSQSLRFTPAGEICCLYTETINLTSLGRLHVVRATDIRFNGQTQQWEVHAGDTDAVLFSHTSRAECLGWEHDNLQPGPQPTI